MKAATEQPKPFGGDAETFQHLLARYLRHVRDVGALPVTQAGWLRKNSFKHLLEALHIPNTSSAEEQHLPLLFIRHLLLAMGELRVNQGDGTHLTYGHGNLLKLPFQKRVQRTFNVWLSGKAWHELYPVDRLSQPNASNPWPAHARHLKPFRAALTEALAALTTDQPGKAWHSQEQVLQWLQQNRPAVLFQNAIHTNPRIFAECGIWRPSSAKDAARLDDLAINQFIAGPLFWMGIVALNAHPPRWQLTTTGRWLLGLEPPPSAGESGRLIVQPNFTVLVMPPIDETLITDLEGFAIFQGGDPALTYLITRESFYAAHTEGWGAAEVIRLLEERQGAPIPANVKRTLHEWEASHQRIVLRTSVCVVQTRDAATTTEVLPALAEVGAQQFGEHFLVLPKSSAAAAQEKLHEEGWQVVSDEDNPTPHIEFYSPHAARVITALPNLHVLDRLRLFGQLRSERDGALVFELDRARVQAVALREGAPAIAFLRAVHRGPLPVEVERLLDHWTHFYGSARVTDLVVIAIEHPAVRAHILADPELKPLVQPIGGAQPLIGVPAAHLEKVLHLLAERGVQVEGTHPAPSMTPLLPQS